MYTLRCNYEGLMVWDAHNLNPTTMSVGPFCYSEPFGLFKSVGVNTIVSTGQKLWVSKVFQRGCYDKLPTICTG